MAPGSRNGASCHLTVGTGGRQQRGSRLKGLYKGSLSAGSTTMVETSGCHPIMQREPGMFLQPMPAFPVVPRDMQQGRSRCPIRTRIRASRTKIRGRNPVSSNRVAARSPDSSSRIRIVRAKNPTSRVRAIGSSDPSYARRSRRKAGLFFLGRGGVVSPVDPVWTPLKTCLFCFLAKA